MSARAHVLVCLGALITLAACGSPPAQHPEASTRTTSASVAGARRPATTELGATRSLETPPEQVLSEPPPKGAGTLAATPGPPIAPPPVVEGAMSDAQIATMLHAIVDAELAQADRSGHHAIRRDVRAFARDVARLFGAAGARLTEAESTHSLGAAESEESREVRASAAQEARDLKARLAPDDAFLDHAVTTATRFMDLLDARTPEAQWPDLRTRLLDVRDALDREIREARAIAARRSP